MLSTSLFFMSEDKNYKNDKNIFCINIYQFLITLSEFLDLTKTYQLISVMESDIKNDI